MGATLKYGMKFNGSQLLAKGEISHLPTFLDKSCDAQIGF